MLYDFDVLEFHVDILRVLEHTLQIVEIFLLGLLNIDHTIVVQRQTGEVTAGLLFHHLTGNDKRLVAEYTCQHGQVLTVISRAEVLHKVHDNLAACIVDVAGFLGHNGFVTMQVNGDGNTINLSVGGKVHSQFLTRLAGIGLNHIHGNATHLIT